MKRVFAGAGFRQVKSLTFTRAEWEDDSSGVVARIERELHYPLFVKPNGLGSSKGVNPAPDEDQLFLAFPVAADADDRIIVEEAVADALEINVAVLGAGDETLASLCEQPQGGDWQSYDRKYTAGAARVDFLIDRDEHVYVNEINTIPGALSLELWRLSGLDPASVVTQLVELAERRHAARSRSNRHMSAL